LKKIVFGIIGAGLLAGCAARTPAPTQPAAPAISPAAAAEASQYVQTALSTDQFVMQSSQLALQTSQNPAVRAYAQRVINDHSQLSAQLNASAQAAGIPGAQVVMLPHHSSQIAQLQYARGADFDGSYRNLQVMTQMQALDIHQRYAASGQVPALQIAASNALPLIQAHLTEAQALAIAPPPPPRTYRRSGERG
jgi:putative membrane protein